MKKIAAIVVPAFIASVGLFSCREDGAQGGVEPTAVDSTTLKPEIKISYTVLDSGWVQFHDNSQNILWTWPWGFDTAREAKYWFPDGEYELRFEYLYSSCRKPCEAMLYGDTTFVIKITNSISPMDTVDTERFIKGKVFGESVDERYTELGIQNNLAGVGFFYGLADAGATIIMKTKDKKYLQVNLADMNTVPGTDIQKMREIFKVGALPLAKLEMDTLGYGGIVINKQVSDGWGLLFQLTEEYAHAPQSTAYSGTSIGDSLEITQVKEIYQPPLFPGLESTAFIVTFHYKGELRGQPVATSAYVSPITPYKGLTDVSFDVKFNMYHIRDGIQYVPYPR